MSGDLDLTEAIEATARALYGDIRSDAALAAACGLVRPYVETYAPIIARQMAEKIADLINAAADPLTSCNAYWNGHIDGMRIAARIAAREVGSDG